MKRLAVLVLVVLGFILSLSAISGDEKRILIYTKNGEGYVHENIAASVAALEKICKEEGIGTDVSDQPLVFTPENLEKYDAIGFHS